MDTGKSYLRAGLLVNDMGLDKIISAIATFCSPRANIPSTLRLFMVRRFALRFSTSAQV